MLTVIFTPFERYRRRSYGIFININAQKLFDNTLHKINDDGSDVFILSEEKEMIFASNPDRMPDTELLGWTVVTVNDLENLHGKAGLMNATRRKRSAGNLS